MQKTELVFVCQFWWLRYAATSDHIILLSYSPADDQMSGADGRMDVADGYQAAERADGYQAG